MPYSQAARDTLHRALRQNWLPPLLLGPDPLARLAPPEPNDELLAHIARTLPRPSATGDPSKSAQPTASVGRIYGWHASMAAGTTRAISQGPIGGPWRLDSVSVHASNPGPDSGITIAATSADLTGDVATWSGDLLLEGRFTDSAGADNYPWVQTGSFGSTVINGPTRIMPAGTYATMFIRSAGAATFHSIGHITEFLTQYIPPAPDVGVISTVRPGPQTRPLPRPRTPKEPTPLGFWIGSSQYRRRVPLSLVDPILLREYATNLANGRQTPGMMPYYE